jgi:heterodisulfide reductase subunit B
VTDAAYENLAAPSPDFVVTSCPLCKKTFTKGKRDIPVIDISEAVMMSLKAAVPSYSSKEEEIELVF